MTRMYFLTLSILVLIIGCSPEESEERYPDHWLSSSNIHEAETLYMRDNKLRMLTKTGVVETVEIKDSDGTVLPDVILQGGCKSGEQFFGTLYSYEAGGNYIVWANPDSGKLVSMKSDNLSNQPCLSRVGSYQIHKWENRTYFEYSENNYAPLSLVEAKIDDENITLKKVFDFPTLLDEVRVLEGGWIFMIYSSLDNQTGDVKKVRITDFQGNIHYDEKSSLAFVVDAYNTKILLEKEASFEILEYKDSVWQTKKITSSPQLEMFSKYVFQPDTTILTFGNNRTIQGVENSGSVDLFEWSNDTVRLKKEVLLNNVYSYRAYGNEIVFLSESESSNNYLVTSYNVESEIQAELEVGIYYSNHRLMYQFTDSNIFFSQKQLNEDGLTVKSYDLFILKNLELGVSNTTPVKIESFIPNNSYSYPGGVYNNFFNIMGAKKL